MSKQNEHYPDLRERHSYETGSTRPPKDRGGLVALLLVLVLILGGACSALGIINIHLLRQIAQGNVEPQRVEFLEQAVTQHSGPRTELSSYGAAVACLGLQGQTVSDFDRRFYELPRGVLITYVADRKNADKAGLRAGDVIVSVNGIDTPSHDELLQILEDFADQEQIRLDFYRQQTKEDLSVSITISRKEE